MASITTVQDRTTDTINRSIDQSVDQDLVAHAQGLTERAGSLRDQAAQLPDLLGAAYRRRASELELEAFLIEVQAGVPFEAAHQPAA